ncbi:ATP-binding protein [[Mycoplasma] testudinis]|uniref:ATP-binding protein n=1 Tax=[Mycoplasma] testudinis TaxID=33924 RepID=UPI00048216AE|nr:ATP-binding protein [[Mycoplasma] testudinis]
MIKRTIQEKIIESIKTYPITLVTGARQVGKSTICYELKNLMGFTYVSLDNAANLRLALDDPQLFLKENKPPLIIDEVQKAPELFSYIAPIVNTARLENGTADGMYVLTGSHQYDLMKNVTESLAGRISIITVSPFSNSEIIGREEKVFEVNPEFLIKRVQKDYSETTLLNNILRGGYPELNIKKTMNVFNFFDNYTHSYIEKDITDILDIKEKDSFRQFLKILAAETGKELNFSLIARGVGVSYKTIQSWISILKTSNLIYTLEPYFEFSVVNRIIKRPKIYFNDTGLACFLNGIKDIQTLKNHVNKGFLMETYVITEILKTYNNSLSGSASFYYYRDGNQNEIDLIMVKDGKLNLIEIKSGTRYNPSAVKAFSLIKSTNYIMGSNALICNAFDLYPIKKDVYIVPVSAI